MDDSVWSSVADPDRDTALDRLTRRLVRSFCTRYGVQDADAQDLAQATFLKVIRRLAADRQRRISHPAGLALKLVADTWSAARRRVTRGLPEAGLPLESAPEPAAQANDLTVDADRIFTIVGGRLPPRERLFLKLWLEPGVSIEQVARSMGICRRTAYQLRSHCLETIRDLA